MQAEDIWLMQTTNPGMCPRCNNPLTRRGTLQAQYASVTCPYCGFSAPSAHVTGQEQPALAPRPSDGSSVWIDPAVSAFLAGRVVHAGLPVPQTAYPKRLAPAPLELGPRKPQPHPLTPISSSAPAIPPAWPGHAMQVLPQYAPSQPRPIQEHDVTRLPTVPPQATAMWQYESPDFEVESSLPALSLVVNAPAHPELTFSDRQNLANEDTDPASWTAGGAPVSPYARRIAGHEERKLKPYAAFKPVDHLRWWLLHPGRLEFMLWLAGTIFLMSVTFVFLLVIALNFAQVTPDLHIEHGTVRDGSSSSSSSNSNSGAGTHPGGGTGKPTVVTTLSGLTLILLDSGPLVPGQAIHLQGKGFSPQGTVTFTDEQNKPMLTLDGQYNSVQADEHGAFIVSVNGIAWAPDHHLVVVRDVATGRVVELPVVLAAGPFGKKGITPTPATPQPGLTATPTQSNGSGGIMPTPVNFTPVPTRPTGNTPTPTPAQPTATPTRGVTPTPTPGATPTAGDTPSPTSPIQGNVDPGLMAASIGSASLHADTNLDAAWLWLLIIGYSISMLMLGIAGMLRKRRY